MSKRILNSSNSLKIYAFPSLNGRCVFHAQFLSPTTNLEYAGMAVAYITRKWRYQISDMMGSHWHKLGQSKQGSVINRIYRFGNRITTRKAADEYFFKQIPSRTEHIEIIFPSCIKQSTVQDQIQVWLADSDKFTSKLAFYGVLLPTNFYIAKFYLLAANVLFTYHVFRVNSSFRAHFGSKRMQELVNRRQVQFTSSQELQDKISSISNKVSLELQKENLSWTWNNDDLHDDVALKLSTELRLPELVQSVRRSRMQYMLPNQRPGIPQRTTGPQNGSPGYPGGYSTRGNPPNLQNGYNYNQQYQPQQQFTPYSRSQSGYSPQPDNQIPSRNTSIQVTTIDDLLNDGAVSMAVPHSNIPNAIEKWNQALVLAKQENDMIRQAKALSNIGCAYRKLGKLDIAKEHLDESWVLTIAYIRQSASKSGSNWLQMAIRATGLEGQYVENAFVTHSEDNQGLKKSNSVKSAKGSNEFSHGPPIVVWVLQLTTNMGNLCFSRGKYEAAIKCHAMCKNLVESIFEEFPLPDELMKISNNASLMKPFTPETNTPLEKKTYRLSYLHRYAIMAQVRAMTHLGACFGALGHSTASLQYHMASHALLDGITDLVPSLVPNIGVSQRSTSINANSSIEASSNTIQLKAAISSNIGVGWHLVGDLAKSAAWHQKSLELFEFNADLTRKKHLVNGTDTRKVGLEEVRQMTQLAGTAISLGAHLKSLNWLKNMENSHDQTYFESSEATQFWNPPKDDFKLSQKSPNEPWLGHERIFDRALASAYLLCNNPLMALYYFGKLVAGQPAHDKQVVSLKTQPAIPPVLLLRTYTLLCQLLFALTQLSPRVLESKLRKQDVSRIQAFVTQSFPNCMLDITRLDQDMVIQITVQVTKKYKDLQEMLNNQLVLSLSRNNYPMDFESFNIDAHPYRIDDIKVNLLRLSNLETKLYWSKASLPTISTDLSLSWYKQALFTFANSINEVLFQSQAVGAASILLSHAADHLEMPFPLSPSIISGSVSPSLLALLGDIIGYVLTTDENQLVLSLRIEENSMVEVRKALLTICQHLILSSLNMCESCNPLNNVDGLVFPLNTANEANTLVPCNHGYVLA
ncbi:hypothetical protein HDV06_002678 [Boothiomyces sp. JEL0866]|nr:hypothetical protein HDV06_002678 [Boothiomyces sp. JEL0866]